jgi:hypothetical protein
MNSTVHSSGLILGRPVQYNDRTFSDRASANLEGITAVRSGLIAGDIIFTGYAVSCRAAQSNRGRALVLLPRTSLALSTVAVAVTHGFPGNEVQDGRYAERHFDLRIAPQGFL